MIRYMYINYKQCILWNGTTIQKEGSVIKYQSSQLKPPSTVPRPILQVCNLQLAKCVRANSTTSKTCIYVNISWNCLFRSTFFIRCAVYSFQLFWYCTTYIYFSWDIFKVTTQRLFKFSWRMYRRVFEELLTLSRALVTGDL